MLAVKLNFKHVDYYPIILYLIEIGANIKIKYTSGWDILQESLMQADILLSSVLFEKFYELKRNLISEEIDRLILILNQMPDFYVEMKWDFEAKYFPFFSKIAPNDTFKIWKWKNHIRIDHSIIGYKKLVSKRRNMSTIFNPTKIPHNETVSKFNKKKSIKWLWILNYSNNYFTNPLQEFDETEKQKILYDLMKTETIQNEIKILDCKIQNKKKIFSFLNDKIDGYSVKRFDFFMQSENNIIKNKFNFFSKTYEEYLQIIKKNKNNEINQDTTDENKKIIKNPKKNKKSKLIFHLSDSFPLKIKDFLPILQILSKGNSLILKMESYLQEKQIKDIMFNQGFPLKIQIPLILSIKANMTLKNFKKLSNNNNFENIFEIPNYLNYIDRKVAQKTLKNSNKREVLTNLLVI